MAAPNIINHDTFFQKPVVFGDTVTMPSGQITNASVAAGSNLAYSKIEHLHHFVYEQSRQAQTHRKRTVWFDLDNGSGTTIDDVVMRPAKAATITAARILYVDATSGTVAAGNAKVGVTLGGAEVVAATAYENTKAVGTTTAMSIVAGAVAADTSVFVRHTGVAATQAGQAVVELDYTYDDDTNNEIYAATVPLHIASVSVGTVVSIEASVDTAPSSTRTHTVDLQKGNASTAYATVLSGTISISSATAVRTPVAGTISTASCNDGDMYQLVIASSGSGNNGRRLKVTLRYAEETA